ncbi:methyl-accepting chemotaxis protein [Acerihabitans sp. TG2]|uniref:methyl-accepting chemotaxis protein n=1 Tax=Acerihabitans sp. TG2 TaxID=3096008 RepID=UPI002B23E96D|nr:methyl-accepting chemotaxis protein [Acerihabitans sp. TG2]MEA9389652.1 methyl-accepting chemotaxis protein [Acerihabitans sp. TG2]
MNKIKSLKVSHKLYFGFGIVLLLVLVATALSVQRFKQIRDIYQKTNLIYDINIDVFQVKVNRVKYLYSLDDKVKNVMAGYIEQATTLTEQAKQLSWGSDARESVNNIAHYLVDFHNSLEQMGVYAQKGLALKTQLDSLYRQNTLDDFKNQLRNLPFDYDFQRKSNELMSLFPELKIQAYNLRLQNDDAALKQLHTSFSQAQTSYHDLLPGLTPEQTSAVETLWGSFVQYKDLSEAYYANANQLANAESAVKVAGDKSSAAVKVIIKIVKEKNDALALGSASITIIIGLIAIMLGIIVAWYITRLITVPVMQNLSLAERIASGDLSATIIADRHDELGQLTSAMGRMNEKLRRMISDVRDCVATVASSAAKIANGNNDLSSRTEQQSAAVVETAASMEELTATVKNNAGNARHASQIAQEASLNAHKGGEVVKNVVKTMDEISLSSRKISDITSVINGIAFQTNILALNAAVEAARAGEQGRGFAVVAGEVRSLSQRSSQAAKEIETLIADTVSRIKVGTELVAQAGGSMEQIVTSVARVNDIMGEISSASEEQSRGIEQIARAVSELDITTQQNAVLVTESSVAANTLEGQSALLETMIANFRLTAEENARLSPSANKPGSVDRSSTPAAKPVKATATSDESWTTF